LRTWRSPVRTRICARCTATGLGLNRPQACTAHGTSSRELYHRYPSAPDRDAPLLAASTNRSVPSTTVCLRTPEAQLRRRPGSNLEGRLNLKLVSSESSSRRPSNRSLSAPVSTLWRSPVSRTRGRTQRCRPWCVWRWPTRQRSPSLFEEDRTPP
jgi:hypothetical protein